MTYPNNFDKIRYIDLLKKQDMLRNEGRFLDDQEDSELLNYGCILQCQIFYNRRTEYVSFLQEYLRYNPSGEDEANLFRFEFFHIYRKDLKLTKTLTQEIIDKGLSVFPTFLLDSKAEGFDALINQIISACEALTFDPEETYGFFSDKFADFIRRILSEMEKYCDS